MNIWWNYLGFLLYAALCFAFVLYLGSQAKKSVKTNADRIRAKTDEELALWLRKIIPPCETCPCDTTCPHTDEPIDCAAMLLAWLQKEVPHD